MCVSTQLTPVRAENIFIILEYIIVTLDTADFPSSCPRKTLISLSSHINVSFLEFHRIGVLLYVKFSFWLLYSTCHIVLKFTHALSYYFYVESNSIHVDILFICLLAYRHLEDYQEYGQENSHESFVQMYAFLFLTRR